MNFSPGPGGGVSWGPLFHYCDLELDPMTFITELDLDLVLIYHCAKRKVSIPCSSKVTAERTHRQKHRHDENITSPHTQAVIIILYLYSPFLYSGLMMLMC